MAKRNPFTTQQERLERLITNVRREVADIKTMVDTERGILTAQIVKIDDPSSPQILRVSEGGTLELGNADSWQVLDMLTVEVSHTGDALETVLHTVKVPGGRMGAKGGLRIFASFRAMGAGNHQFFVRFDGALVSFWSATATNYMLDLTTAYIWNLAATLQGAGIQDVVRHQKSTESPFSGAIDTTNDVDLTFAAKNVVGGDVVYLRFVSVEVLHRN